MTAGRASTLNQFLEFRNGKTSPDRTGEGAHAVFGSNGEIGRSDTTNATGPLVVIGRVGSYCGSLFYSEADAWVTDNAIVCSSKNSKDVRYWYYAMQTLDLNGRSSGSGQPLLNQSVLGGIAFEPPEMDVRQAIAEVLGALDDKIAANTKLAASLTGLLDARFEQLGLNSDFENDRQILSLDDLVELNPKVAAPKEAEPIYVDMQKLPTAGMSISGWERRPAKGGARFMNGDTLLARITPCLENRKTGYVDFLPEDRAAIGSTEFIVMRSRPGVPKQLSHFLATSERFRSYAIRHMVGTSGRQRVSALVLAGYTVSKPDSEALARFGEVSTLYFKLLKSLTDEKGTLAATRDALLPQLMSGQLQVKDAEKILENAAV